MTPHQVMLIKTSWAKVVPIADQAAELFYGKLFELNPDLKPLFRNNMKEQGRKLMAMINTAVNGLDRLNEIVPAVEDLGRRHVQYGVQEKDYKTVGVALIWTLGAGLGAAFTDEVKAAWVEVYGVLSNTMINAAQKAA